MAVKFPEVTEASEEGLLALGGTLDVETIVTAYLNGIFPWPIDENHPITWFAPDPRGLLMFDDFRVSKSLKKFLSKCPYEVRFNSDFEQVIKHCSNTKRKNEKGTWIFDNIINAYIEMYNQGYAYCVAVYHQEKLIGGLYGVCIGELITGESMFHLETNASKVALNALIQKLMSKKIKWIDTQMVTPVIESFGGKEVPREDYMKLLPLIDLTPTREDLFG